MESLAETVGEVASFSALCVSAPDTVVGLGGGDLFGLLKCFFFLFLFRNSRKYRNCFFRKSTISLDISVDLYLVGTPL